MKNPTEKANELIQDFIEMMPTGIDKLGYCYKTQYEVAKIQAEYCAHVAKYSHGKESKKGKYWQEVQKQIKQL
jgi:hypothetical protein